jgi:hypothetical protein
MAQPSIGWVDEIAVSARWRFHQSSYTKGDRGVYLDRVGGEEEAERRRKTLMARQSGSGSPKSANVTA